MPEWHLVYDGFEPAKEGLREALCTVGNGYFATRGAAEESEADDIHYPGTYLAGGYNRLASEVAGRVVENEDLVNLPNWLSLTFRPEGGDWFNLRGVDVLDYRQTLDVREGVLERRVRFRDRQGRISRLCSRRLVHMALAHIAALSVTLQPENWSGGIEVRSALDGRVSNAGVERYRQLNGEHLSPVETREIGDDGMLLAVETTQSGLRVAQAASTRVFRGDETVTVERRTIQEDRYIEQVLTFRVEEGDAATVEKTVALHTSRDRAIAEPGEAAAAALGEAGRFADLLASHARAWRLLWDRCDLAPEDGSRTQLILRFHIFHLLQTVSLNTVDLDVGVPARGLHGEAYRGHVFWDELFILPFLNFHLPQISRALLLYRYRRLSEARRLAREAGFAGATFPWQSGSTGGEESQVLHLNPRSGRWTPDNSHLQRHVSLAIAFNIWRYVQTTGDHTFLEDFGVEMLVEIARFWASIAAHDVESDRYDIRGIMGPDEFHDRYPWCEEPGLDNNAYTNVMAAWVLRRAGQALTMLGATRRREIESLLGVTEEETAAWERISRRMRVLFLDDGIIAQFEGYDRLQELDWEGYARKYGDIQRLDRILEAEGDTVNRYKASKQADVLMLFYLLSSDELCDLLASLGYPFDAEAIPRNVDYYVSRTSNGSTLSRIVHSWVLARADRRRSWTLLSEALESDVTDIQGGTTAEGIHLGAMAGTIDLVQRGQTALEFREDMICLSPWLAAELQGMRMKLLYRGNWLHVEIGCDRLVVSAPEGWNGPAKIRVRDQVYDFRAGEALEFACRKEDGGWRPHPRRVARTASAG